MNTVYLIVALGAAAAGFVQGLSGFAFSMVAMSFWAWTLDPRLAAALAVFGGFTGQLIAAVSMRRPLNVPLLGPFVAGGLCGLPLGLWLLPQLDINMFKAGLGLMLVLWCPAMLMARNLPRIPSFGRRVDGLVNGLVGIVGGAMGGIGGFTGTVPTLWCTLRGFDKDSQRAVIQNFNLAMLGVTLASYMATGILQVQMWPYLAVVVPAMLIPTALGARLYIGISEARFKQIVLGLLTLSGISLLGSALPALIARAGAHA